MTPNFHNIARDIRARDEVFFHGERVLSRGNSDVPEIEGDAADFDEHLVFVNFTDGLFDNVQVFKAGLSCKAEDFLGSHVVDAKVMLGICVLAAVNFFSSSLCMLF